MFCAEMQRKRSMTLDIRLTAMGPEGETSHSQIQAQSDLSHCLLNRLDSVRRQSVTGERRDIAAFTRNLT